MKLSRDWITRYVDLPPEAAEPPAGAAHRGVEAGMPDLAHRLTAAGLAVEYVEEVGGQVVFDVDVTTNRPDAMCHYGVAREASALYDVDLTPPPIAPEEGLGADGRSADGSGETTADAIRVTLEDGGCARFSARVVRGVKVGPSPRWLADALEAVGVRSINNVVDATNYVLWELGKPIHAYDLSTLAGPEIRVRLGRDGEKLVTLDGQERTVGPDVLLIADAERAVGIGGVMGELTTEVTETTTDVLIESAHFEPSVIRRSSKKVGLHTDASHRFERGADPELTAFGASRTAYLIRELAGGRVLPGVVDVRWDEGASWRREGTLVASRLARFMGLEVPREDVERWLTRLGFELEPLGDPGEGRWRVRVPSWRFYDFEACGEDGGVYEAYLFEEVVRMHGLAEIPSTVPPHRSTEPPLAAHLAARHRAQDHLVSCGYAEAINFAFHSREELAALPVLRGSGEAEGGAPRVMELANPLSELYAVMRRSLVPGLVASARFNQRRGAPAVRLFEVGRGFVPSSSGEKGAFPEEVELVSVVAGGNLGSPWERSRDIDFYDVKGVMESLAEISGVELTFRPARAVGLTPGATAEILLGDEVVGLLGRVEEEEAYPFYAAELRLSALVREDWFPQVEVPSRFPSVAADLTFTHPTSHTWSEIREAVEAARPEHLVSFRLLDRYSGKGVPEGSVNTTLSFLYQAEDRSLTHEEVNERQEEIARMLETRFGEGGGR